ncbi:hypothetical protein VTN96DRAFT_642 [Rasamsonia emersonii]|uniref:CENP-V/GFA domain-containing protein n=1 Tax=Rasamsonia emersonii (strain ATCC 16479 / CBS 393.64 / IMI 116815) TaxID=1408163 RepID=A0A0F4YS29_RASE3|nr:hypothetical protein T310_5547 [Rasamsonia emersonii CBS 393.64]KKA20428.1 hypothetical protein T310_5547 [Rasamsonia emersonii CBS 393.64]
MSLIKGRCHCKQTEWTVRLEDKSHVLCHCGTCKYLSGTDYTLNQIIPREDFRLDKGELKAYTYYGDSGNPVHCYYCPNCTAHVYHHQAVNPSKYVIRTALLEGSKDWKPSAEIYAKDRYHWQPAVAPKGAVFQTGPPAKL